jgi:hypothetical protein
MIWNWLIWRLFELKYLVAKNEGIEMVELKTAVKTAMEHFTSILEGSGIDYRDLNLEEVQIEGEYWIITFGYNLPSRTHVLSAAPYREYKTITINAHTGAFVSMKIRLP